jgi:hypothetical protein
MWSNKANSSNGSSSSRSKRANISSYLGNGSPSNGLSHSRLVEDDASISSLEDEELLLDLQGQALQPKLMKHTSSSSTESSDSSSLPAIHEVYDALDASNEYSTVRNSSRMIVENHLDLDDIEDAYMLSVWSAADVDVGVGGSSVYSGKSFGKASLATASTSRSLSSLSTTRSSRHRGAARKRIDRDQQSYLSTSNKQGWVASFQVASAFHNCGDWEPENGFFKRQPFQLGMATSDSATDYSNSIWQEPTPFDYCKKERIEV